MAKNIVLCSDGTGNSGGKERGTNVWKTYLAVDRHPHVHRTGITQVAFYDDGVGTSDFRLVKIMGGAVGLGLGRNIRQLYTSLARTYEAGDHIYLFGFSRGAYTVRSLSGMISEIGIIDGRGLKRPSDLSKYVKKAYRAYRAEYAGRRKAEAKTRPIPRSPKAKAFRTWCGAEGVACNDADGVFIGVWDTVDAVGVPVDGLRNALSLLAFSRRPHVDRLTPNVRYAFHALSIDDERRTFKPVMWHDADKAAGAILEQVWFAGVHSNVGGGYPKEGLATVSLYWMMDKAQGKTVPGGDLRFVPDADQTAHDQANAHSTLYDSRAGLASYYRYQVRDLESLSDGQPWVDITALDRVAHATDGYAPTKGLSDNY